MKAVKVIGGLAVILALVVVVGGYVLVSNLNGIIKTIVEDVGSELTQTRVTLDGVELDLKTGKGQLNGLTIANPKGFDSDYAFRLENIVVALDLKSLTGPVIVISEVKIEGAKVIAEQKGQRTNLGEIMKNVEASSNQSEGKTTAPEEDATEVHLMIEKFAFVNTKGTVITEMYGEKTLKLPNVRRKNIGNKTTGLTPEQLSNQVLKTVIRQIQKAAKGYIADLAQDAIEEKLKEKLSEETGIDPEKIGDALKSLFK